MLPGAPEKTNYGLGVMFSSSHESGSRSFYTKKFWKGYRVLFRGPVIEARWDSSYRDDQRNFYFALR